MEKKSQNSDKNKFEKSGSTNNSMDDSITEKTGYEASDIIEDALQLAVDDELKDDREDINNESGQTGQRGHSSKVNINSSDIEVNSQKYTQDSTPEQSQGMLSPPKPETAPVLAPLTIEDKISMDTSKRNSGTDEASMIVNLDDTNTDLMDTDIDGSQNTNESNENKTNRKSSDNSSDSKSVSNSIMNSSNEEINPSPKDMNKLSEKDSSKSKSSNQRESKLKSKDSKKDNTVGQKGQNNPKNNIWVSGLSQITKACELQTIFSKHGKVVSAKIIKNARMSGSRCFGFITMESSEQVLKCIAQLNKTELHGRTIALSRNRPQESTSKPAVTRSKPNSVKRDINKNIPKESEVKETKNDEKVDENKAKKSEEKHSSNKSVSESGSNKGSETKDRRKPIRAPVRDRPLIFRRPMIPFHKRGIPFRRPFPSNSIRGFHRPVFGRGGIRPTFPTFPIKRQDIDRNIRERERERRIREERRHREELLRVDLEREERIRFEREKERLKLERMKLEREKAEFFKFERERAKLEREKIEREREELNRRRQQNQSVIQHRVEDSRSRSSIVSSALGKRPFESSRDIRSNDPFWEERKRIQNIQRMDSHLIPGRQNFVESSSTVGNRHSIPHSYESRNDSYKRNTRIDIPMAANSRPEFDARRHDSRHAIGHDRDDRKNTGPSYYRGGENPRNTSFASRDRRLGAQREDWKSGHDSRRSDRYSDKAMSGGSNSFPVNSRYGSDSRGWDRSSNSMNKVSYGSGNIHMSGSQPWTPSMSGRWNSAISSSSESRNRGQSSHNSSMLSGANPSITELFSSTPMSGIGLNISHSMGAGNSLNSGDRPYIHSNRRF